MKISCNESDSESEESDSESDENQRNSATRPVTQFFPPIVVQRITPRNTASSEGSTRLQPPKIPSSSEISTHLSESDNVTNFINSLAKLLTNNFE